MLEEKIFNDYKESMKNRDKVRAQTLSFLRSQLKNLAIAQKKEKLEDNLVIDVIRQQIKQRQEAILKFEQANRNDLSQKEKQELDVLKSYLPPEISLEELGKIIDDIILQTQAMGLKDMGKVMKEAKIKISSRIDNQTLSQFIKDKLANIK